MLCLCCSLSHFFFFLCLAVDSVILMVAEVMFHFDFNIAMAKEMCAKTFTSLCSAIFFNHLIFSKVSFCCLKGPCPCCQFSRFFLWTRILYGFPLDKLVKYPLEYLMTVLRNCTEFSGCLTLMVVTAQLLLSWNLVYYRTSHIELCCSSAHCDLKFECSRTAYTWAVLLINSVVTWAFV